MQVFIIDVIDTKVNDVKDKPIESGVPDEVEAGEDRYLLPPRRVGQSCPQPVPGAVRWEERVRGEARAERVGRD